MYDKKLEEYKQEIKHLEYTIELKRHIAKDTSEAFKEIRKYLDNQKNIDEKVLNKATAIERYLSEIERKYESFSIEK